jgi:hypothetical protein
MTIRRGLIAAGLVAAVACSDSNGSGGGSVPPGSLSFVLLPASVPALCEADDSVGFWAYKGIGADTALTFPEAGHTCAESREDFLRLKLDGASLYQYPDGTPINPGDSVFITIKWVGSDSILFKLGPTGLVFDPAHPADLTIDYSETGGDLDHDGIVDAEDSTIEHRVDIWRQPTLTDDYTKVGTAKFEEQDEIEAKLNGFSRYALAY